MRHITTTLLAILFLGKIAVFAAETDQANSPGRADLLGVANIRVAKDFRIELLYTVPRKTQGSWVAMCIDPKGRLITSDQNGALYRVTLPESNGGDVKTEKINLNVGFAHG